MNERELAKALGPGLAERLGELHYFSSIGSTNSEALRLAKERGSSNRLLLAGSQTAGRGRRGRSWISPADSGIFLSIGRPMSEKLESLQSLSLVTALSVHSALAELGAKDLLLKWPNDVLHGNRKLAGILLESQANSRSTYLVFGIGINLLLAEAVRELIGRPITDLRAVIGESQDAGEVIRAVSSTLLHNLSRFADSGFDAFVEDWNRVDRYRGKDVILASGERKMIGRSHGVDASGALILETAAGRQAILGGEIFPSLAAVQESD